jgi:RNA polymerase sigma-70 factor (ECF subfamily)
MIATGERTLILELDGVGERGDAEVDVGPLVELYGALLFRVAHSVVRSRADAEDVVQDTFVRAMEHRAKLATVRDMRVWLVRIAWNLAVDRRRKIRPEQMDEAFAAGLAARAAPADKALGDARRVKTMLEALEKLPSVERQALLLAGVEELSTVEIAGVIGKTESATRAVLFRARTRLKERLERKGGWR